MSPASSNATCLSANPAAGERHRISRCRIKKRRRKRRRGRRGGSGRGRETFVFTGKFAE